MPVDDHYQGSDDSDSEGDQFTGGNRDSIDNFLGPRHEDAQAEEDSTSSSDEDGATVAAEDDAAAAMALLSATAV